jgi:hypothetical protein
MKAAGYVTYHRGKRGNTPQDIQRHFEHNDYLDDRADRTSGEPGKAVADDAVAFIERHNYSRPL